MVKVPKLATELEFDPGRETNVNATCSVCGKSVSKMDDAYCATGVRGGTHVMHVDCTRRVGLLW